MDPSDESTIRPARPFVKPAILNFQTARFAPMNDTAYMLFLPTYAADAWYHRKLPADLQAKDLGALIQDASGTK